MSHHKILHVFFNFSTKIFMIRSLESSLPVDSDVEDYQRDDGGPDVEDGVHPEEVDIQVPEVHPIGKYKS